jgi:GDP-L-fucose synthase
MNPDSRIYIAGHTGLVGSALLRGLQAEGYTNLITRTHAELDLERQEEVETFFERERPEYVFLAAAKVGGIWANRTYPAEFVYRNLAIQTSVIHAAWKTGVRRLLFLGSSCVYPRECPQPMKEEYLLTGPLELTNEPYGVAKIAGIIQCEAYNRQYGTQFMAVMPTNLYGPNDNFDLEDSHVLPALIRKFHLAKLASRGDWDAIQRDEAHYGRIPDDFLANLVAIARGQGHDTFPAAYRSPLTAHDAPPSVAIWGTGNPRREFLHVDDLADACLFIINVDGDTFRSLLTACRLPLINIGWQKDISIRELAFLIEDIVDSRAGLLFDSAKPDGTPQKLLDISKLRSLNWSPRLSLRQGVALTYDWFRKSSSPASH